MACDAGRGLLDTVLSAAQDRGLLKSGGRARTDSTHVQSAARDLCWLEPVGETLRSALNAVAAAAPGWPAGTTAPEWFEHYGTPLQESRFPKSRTKPASVGERIGADGMLLLQAAWSGHAPPEVRSLEAVEILRQVWVQHFEIVEGVVRRRGPKDIPPGAMRVVTPYDLQARGSVKRDIVWNGYKVHFTETCEPDAPNLLTQVVTTAGPVPDDRMAAVVHARLAETGGPHRRLAHLNPPSPHTNLPPGSTSPRWITSGAKQGPNSPTASASAPRAPARHTGGRPVSGRRAADRRAGPGRGRAGRGTSRPDPWPRRAAASWWKRRARRSGGPGPRPCPRRPG